MSLFKKKKHKNNDINESLTIPTREDKTITQELDNYI